MAEEKKEDKKEKEQQEKADTEAKQQELLEKQEAIAERIEKGNETLNELLVKQERMQAEAALSGSSEAGTPPKTDEEKADDAARAQLKGTGYEDRLFPEKKEKQ